MSSQSQQDNQIQPIDDADEHLPEQREMANGQQRYGSPASSQESFHGFHEWEVTLDPVTMKELKIIFRQRAQVQQKVLRVQRMLLSQQRPGLASLTVMSKTLAAAYNEYGAFHSKALALVPDAALEEQADTYEEFEEIYNIVSTAVEELLLVTKANAAPPANGKPHVIVQQQPLRVPIPTFDGSYASWPKFKAIFHDLMAKSGDTDAIKLYHLDKALVGEAAGILDAKVLSEGNYQQAWSILTERFENMRVIVESHIRGLLSLRRMSTESHKELRLLLDEATRHVESLRYLQQDVIGVSEHIIVFLIASALDKSTRKAWESTQKKGELPKYEPTIKFLMSRCQILENCEVAFQTCL